MDGKFEHGYSVCVKVYDDYGKRDKERYRRELQDGDRQSCTVVVSGLTYSRGRRCSDWILQVVRYDVAIVISGHAGWLQEGGPVVAR
ncbi:uncharacterized protein A4U43_C05F13640 [Asparagus officinalis]|uniref:Rhodanese domain-containing protein n=1 Tax=Asparagus officinalis TaxID=4686 RepID=A0A5P1ERL4_ASPOF|nr:uncharacterized protein A4U43_C05F13640 [Asparagus officinalis]